MDLTEHQSVSNRNDQTWPISFDQTDGNSQTEINYEPEADLTSLASRNLSHVSIEIENETSMEDDRKSIASPAR